MRLFVLAAALWALAAPSMAQPAGAADPACRAALAFSAERRGAAVLALKDGKPVCEGYAASGGPETPMEIWSGTKSFSGLMLAAAVQDGLIASLDEPVATTLPEWRDDPAKARVTLRQLLSLTSGVRSTVGQVPTYADAIRIPLSTPPGEAFSYGPGPYQVFGEVMRRKLVAAGQPGDPYLYLKRRILDPIGLTPGAWRHMPNGDALLPQGAVLTAREWAKFGELVRAGGVWKGKPLVDRATFAELFKPAPANPAYGVTFWLPNPGVAAGGAGTDLGGAPDIPRDLVLAAGAGNQRLYIIPSRRLVVARLAEFDGRPAPGGPRWSDAEFIRFFLK
jgi:CubicO group peptidase (beta-lactamase class C family)